jgi:hypothetical protein
MTLDCHHCRPERAGKTTFAQEYPPQEAGLPDFINVDLIAGPVAVRAGQGRATAEQAYAGRDCTLSQPGRRGWD